MDFISICFFVFFQCIVMEECKPVPQLMVLYESSGTQIQFSDGSRLRLAPCGTTFSYQVPPNPQDHPLQGTVAGIYFPYFVLYLFWV